MATPGKQGKSMSSRLAGMKFMQRSGASTPSTPNTPAEPPSKKQRLSNGSSIRSPATPVDLDERRRAEAVEKEAARRGETKWYLSFREPQVPATESPLRIVSAGFSALDAGHNQETQDDEDDEETARPQVAGRKSFGNFNRAKQQKTDEDSEDDSDEDDEEGEIEDDLTGVNALIAQGRKEATDRARAERKAKKAAEGAESQRLAEERRKKEVNLNKVHSISSGGGRISGGSGQKKMSNLENVICHRCGEKGHIIRDCRQRSRR